MHVVLVKETCKWYWSKRHARGTGVRDIHVVPV